MQPWLRTRRIHFGGGCRIKAYFGGGCRNRAHVGGIVGIRSIFAGLSAGASIPPPKGHGARFPQPCPLPPFLRLTDLVYFSFSLVLTTRESTLSHVELRLLLRVCFVVVILIRSELVNCVSKLRVSAYFLQGFDDLQLYTTTLTISTSDFVTLYCERRMERHVESDGSGTLPMRSRSRVLGQNDMSELTRAPRRSKSLSRDDRLPTRGDGKSHGPSRANPSGHGPSDPKSHRTLPTRDGQTDSSTDITTPKGGKAFVSRVGADADYYEEVELRSFTVSNLISSPFLTILNSTDHTSRYNLRPRVI